MVNREFLLIIAKECGEGECEERGEEESQYAKAHVDEVRTLVACDPIAGGYITLAPDDGEEYGEEG